MTEEVASQQRRSGASLLAQTKALLRRFHLRAKKSLGQHFLIDEEVLSLIVTAAEVTAADTVMEVGPGLGVLTRELARRAGRVVAVELDDRLAGILKKTAAAWGNVTVIHRDILEVEPEALLGEPKTRYKVVADLPYYITSMALRHFLEAKVKPELMVVMVQKEVAQAIVAEPGDMSLLSVSVQFYGKPRLVRKVPAQCFYPAPKVDSAILRIDLYSQPPVAVDDTDRFFDLVRAGFSAPRKQLPNALSPRLNLPKAQVLSLLDRAGIVSQRRAETLSLEEWARLWRIYTGARE